ncbi:hypothetical protein ACK6VV_24075, partial [Escherichia coli]
DRNRSHWSTSKTPSYTKSVSWQHHPGFLLLAVMYEPVVNNVENTSVAFVIILLTKQTPVSLK